MSYSILQSTKVYKLHDSNGNTVYISGYVAESNNISPKRYDTIYFHLASKDILTCIQEAYHYADGVISGCIQLKNGNDKTTADDIDTVVRRFTRNVRLAKSIEVEEINFHNGQVTIIWGDAGFSKIANIERSFYIYPRPDETFTLRVAEYSEHVQAKLDYINGNRSFEQAIKVSEIDGYLGAFFSPQEITKEQLTTLIQNCDEWVHRYIYSNTTTRLTSEEMTAATENMTFRDERNREWFMSSVSCLVNEKQDPITIEQVKAKLSSLTVKAEGDWYRTILVYLANEVNDEEPNLLDEIQRKVEDYGKANVWIFGQKVTFQEKPQQ